MNVVALRAPSAQTLLRLGRVSNLPTVWTNVIAGTTIANTAASIVDVALVGLAMTAFYVGGMYLNDFFDRDIDARERPGRPIHAGDISASAVSAIGFALLAVGVALLARFGLLTVILGLALAGSIVLYDAWHKGNVFAPVIMGLCRALVYLVTGAAVSGEIRFALIAGAMALATHVIGLTYAAKQENLNQVGRLWPLAILAGPLLLAAPGISSGWLVVVGCLVVRRGRYRCRAPAGKAGCTRCRATRRFDADRCDLPGRRVGCGTVRGWDPARLHLRERVSPYAAFSDGYSGNVMQALVRSSGHNGSGRADMAVCDGFLALADEWISRAANENAVSWFRDTIERIRHEIRRR